MHLISHPLGLQLDVLSSQFTLVLECHRLATPLVCFLYRAAAEIIFVMFPISRCEYFYICVISLPDTPRTAQSQAGAIAEYTGIWNMHHSSMDTSPRPIFANRGLPLSLIIPGALVAYCWAFSLSARTPISSLVLQCSLRHLRCDLCALYVGPFSRLFSYWCDLFSGYCTLTAVCSWHCISYRNIASVSFTFFRPL